MMAYYLAPLSLSLARARTLRGGKWIAGKQVLAAVTGLKKNMVRGRGK